MAPALYIAGANFRTAFLEYWNGAAWVAIGTWDGASEVPITLSFDRTGNTITPKAGTAALGRYVRHGQLKGGHVVLTGTVARNLLNHGAGAWSDNTATAIPRLVLHLKDAVVGDPATGACFVMQNNGLMVSYNTAAVYASKWRVRVPVQTVADAYYKASVIMPSYFVAMGQQWSNGYSVDATRAVASATDRNNTEYRESRGAVSRLWSLPFGDVYAEGKLALQPDAPDHVGVSGALALTARYDVFSLLYGVLKESGGHVPIVAVRKAPTSSGMVLDFDSLLYGYLDGPAGYDNTAGDDRSTSEVNRGSTVRVIEIV